MTGPILFFLALEHGAPFAAQAAATSLSAVVASIAFSAAYAQVSRRLAWLPSLLIALAAWSVAGVALSMLPASAPLALCIAVLMLLVAPRLFPAPETLGTARANSSIELGLRMLAGASLTVIVTLVAARVGSGWSGLLAVFPILGPVLAVFSHRSQGQVFAATLLRGMASGLYSFVAFCFTVSILLPYAGTGAAFAVAVLASITVQHFSKGQLKPSPNP